MLGFDAASLLGHDLDSAHPYRPDGRLMIKSFKLINFRCFRHEEAGDCRRVNLLVGRNASGKTSFLEGVFLAMGHSPESVNRLRQWRGIDIGVHQGTAVALFDAYWGDLFFDKFKGHAELIAAGDNLHTRKLSIVTGGSRVPEIAQVGMIPSNVAFKWQSKGQPEFESVPFMVGAQLQLPTGPHPGVEVFFFAANHAYSSIESASRLSELSKLLKLTDFTGVFKQRYPAIEELSVELLAGLPLIFAKLKDVDRRVPLSFVSGGMNKFASMLLSFAVSPGSIVLIDEIENGLYYKDMPDIWNLLLAFAIRYDCQIFASTHSGECIEAAGEVAAKHCEEFSVIQMNKGKLNQFEGKKFVQAFEENIEIR